MARIHTPPELDARVGEVARSVRAAGGRLLLVGGGVRDHLLGRAAGDADLEILGLSLDELHELLARHGTVVRVGRAFGVLRIKGLDADFALPRRARGDGTPDPELDFTAASLRRDLRINAMGLDPLTGEVLDPHGGRADLGARRLRATDPASFGEDPLRGLRVARLAAQLAFEPDDALLSLCAGLDLGGVAPERLFQEFRRLLATSRPSRGLEVLRHGGMLPAFPELFALVGVVQDPRWHPEGDVWVHTTMVVDEAARARIGDASDEALMFAALCHDLGKPETTEVGDGVRAYGHDVAGVEPTRRWLERLRAPQDLLRSVLALVRHHLAPAQLGGGGAGPRAYRRLARQLSRGGVSMALLERLGRADALGRSTGDARARRFPAGDAFLARARECRVSEAPRREVVLGRHLLARGVPPGPRMGALLERCRQVQDETGLEDADAILERVLPHTDPAPTRSGCNHD